MVAGALPWLLGGVPIAVALTRVMVAARFDDDTAAAIIASADPLGVLAGSSSRRCRSWPPYLAYLLALAIPRAAGTSAEDITITGAICIALVAFTATTVMSLVIILVTPVLATLNWARRRGEKPAGWRWFWKRSKAGVLYYLVFYIGMHIFIFDSMWLPSEVISHGNHETVGYVLDEEGEWMTILRDEDRTIARFAAGDVNGRELCHQYPRRWWTSTIPHVIVGRPEPEYPQCPRP